MRHPFKRPVLLPLSGLLLVLSAMPAYAGENPLKAREVFNVTCTGQPYCRSEKKTQASGNQSNRINAVCRSPQNNFEYPATLIFTRNDLGANGARKSGVLGLTKENGEEVWIYDGGPATGMDIRVHVFCWRHMGNFGRHVLEILRGARAYRVQAGYKASEETRMKLLQAFVRYGLSAETVARLGTLVDQPVALLKETIVIEGTPGLVKYSQ